ncbi:Hypothetical protein PHPALM_3899 [Phytophthora palmivora]|uniref:Uncharacterized protein n=1 Tax=Phytophthora palmivora TaxID=4796 RepID=A0A2P4YL94_9STRA|nr:Hypothetical protein PHPALM_3899 [Phytophthora palmivora]
MLALQHRTLDALLHLIHEAHRNLKDMGRVQRTCTKKAFDARKVGSPSTGCKHRLDVYAIGGKVLVTEHTCVHVTFVFIVLAEIITSDIFSAQLKQIRAYCSAKGIDYSHSKWCAFWVYFRVTWLERFNIEGWTVHSFDETL